MLVQFSVENFLSFEQKQTLTMIPAKKAANLDKHRIGLEALSLLRTATIYGANASGKSNFIQAMRFAKQVITEKLPLHSAKMYCRNRKENKKRLTKFEFELLKNGKYYAYGCSCTMNNLISSIFVTVRKN